MRAQAETVAIEVFGDSLRDLLLAAPAGKPVVTGLDPGIRTGVQVAVVSATGRVEATTTVYPHEPQRDCHGALRTLTQLARAHGVDLVAIGNGTASRETDKLAGELIAALQEGGAPRVQKVVVSEAVLRSRGGSNPLDASGVHPEACPVVDRIAAATGKPVAALIKRSDLLRRLRPEPFADARFGVVTVKDLLAELDKPGRDPRPDFKVARLAGGIEDLKNLVPGMLLEGTVSNVAQFGSFVDLGVHLDGLVHVSQRANRFVKDAREVVKTGDIVKVRVVEVDAVRKRIALTMKLDTPLPAPADRSPSAAGSLSRKDAARGAAPVAGSMAAAFAKLRQSDSAQ